ncbi:XshC-Cox1 family protein [Rahnella victoriana]|uniref:XdhC family protein n=1 Tax=Rahnella victoriana TaxID=1510570 RepID=UPI000BB1B9C1|nr:XdhC family protein [Rahnella victoriana]PBI79258.1 XshC-Cox1 family protein [Rahnella victoriana]
MQSLDISVISQSARWINDQSIWLCTVLSTFGSSPRPPGTLMVINRDGHFCGSLSGGCIEDDFIQRIRDGDFRQPSQVVRYGDGGLTPDRALPCGGVLDILIEYLAPTAANQAYIAGIGQSLNRHFALKKRITPPAACHSLTQETWRSSTIVERDTSEIVITLACAPRIIIAGLSAVAVFCAEFASGLGFETVICEPREDILENFRGQISGSPILETVFPARYLEQHGCHANTAIVALTHDPRMDDLTMMEAVNTDAFYIGVMGSLRNSQNRIRRLETTGGMTAEELTRIHAPIGIDIGSKTPAEIALAVMADIVRIKNQRTVSVSR